MQNQNLNLILERVSQLFRVFRGQVPGDRQISRQFPWQSGDRGKGQYIGGGIFRPETAVQTAHLGVMRDQYIDRPLELHGSARSPHKALEQSGGGTRNPLFQNNHRWRQSREAPVASPANPRKKFTRFYSAARVSALGVLPADSPFAFGLGSSAKDNWVAPCCVLYSSYARTIRCTR